MDGLWTANFEMDADKIAPILAQNVSAAAGVYFFLHSRVFACKNSIGISVPRLAEKIGISRRTAQRAIRQLQDAGLIAHEAKCGNGGGSNFRLIGISNATWATRLDDGERDTDDELNATKAPRSPPLNASEASRLTRHERRITETLELTAKEKKHDSDCPYDN